MPKRKDHLKETFCKIKLLFGATLRASKQLIANGDRELIDCISECCANILKGNVPLNDQQKAKLCKHKNNLRKTCIEESQLKEKETNHTNRRIPHRRHSGARRIGYSQPALPLTWNMQRKCFW